ncbi:OmpW/AlkL family protein [Pseudomonas segetis]|uniref:OmpW/AlkL family protein n=1 Tax=Pseudomonas sp. RL_15y_Pfl2_60 TaxID=3088709 RepID=UPI0030DA7796
MNKYTLIAPLLALAMAPTFAHAYEAGDIIVRAGAITVDPNEDSSGVKSPLGNLGGSATVESDTQLGLNFAYMMTDHLGIELLAATPFTHDVGVHGLQGGLAGLNGGLGDVKQLPPTLSLVYYPLDKNYAFQPYVGVGINYTAFYDANTSSSAEAKGFSNLDLSDSWGAAAQIGADYMIDDHWMINGQVRYIDIDTNAHVDLAGVGKLKLDVDVDPWVYMVGLGYKF